MDYSQSLLNHLPVYSLHPGCKLFLHEYSKSPGPFMFSPPAQESSTAPPCILDKGQALPGNLHDMSSTDQDLSSVYHQSRHTARSSPNTSCVSLVTRFPHTRLSWSLSSKAIFPSHCFHWLYLHLSYGRPCLDMVSTFICRNYLFTSERLQFTKVWKQGSLTEYTRASHFEGI